MIELIKEKVEMPPMEERRYQRGKCIDPKGWEVIDTELGQVRWKGRYVESCLVLHNLNKKHYLGLNQLK
jgi:hypothetical protein